MGQGENKQLTPSTKFGVLQDVPFSSPSLLSKPSDLLKFAVIPVDLLFSKGI